MPFKSSQKSCPVLYSYRRCPYAMRARLALYFSSLQIEQREIVFWDKPQLMLDASPKGTVPVLVLADSTVIDESWDIMRWALQGKSPLYPQSIQPQQTLQQWIAENDGEFKANLDAYKYPDQYPETATEQARAQGEVFLQRIESQLQKTSFLLGDELSIADLAIFPFIRQFAHVDKEWFAQADYPALKSWLQGNLSSDYFKAVMKNRPVWQPGHRPLWLYEPELQTRDQFRARAEGNSAS